MSSAQRVVYRSGRLGDADTGEEARRGAREGMLEHLWRVGSPETVATKIPHLYETSGGFGVVLAIVLVHSGDRRGWDRCLRLLAAEVMSRVSGLTGEEATPVAAADN